MTINIFVSYSHKDKLARDKFQTHLTPLAREGIDLWWDDRIPAGGELDPDIRRALRNADIFVALASPDYLRSEYCYVTEYGYATRRAARKSMYVVAAIIRPCQWKHTRMGRYKALPNDGKPASQWANRDLAYEDMAEGLRRVVALAKAEKSAKVATRAARKTVAARKKLVDPTSTAKLSGRPRSGSGASRPARTSAGRAAAPSFGPKAPKARK